MTCLVECLGEIITETAAVEHAAHADDAVARKSRGLECKIGHRIHRVGDDDEDRIRGMLQRLLHNTLDDLCVDTDKLLTRHARLTRKAGGNDDNIGICRRSVVIRNTLDRRVKAERMRALHHVHCLALGDTLFDVDKDNLTRKLLERNDVCYGSTYVTCTNNSYLHTYFLLK